MKEKAVIDRMNPEQVETTNQQGDDTTDNHDHNEEFDDILLPLVSQIKGRKNLVDSRVV